MQRFLFILFFLINITLSNSQIFKNEGSIEEIIAFKPIYYTMLDSTTGDLNKDGITDLILVYKKDNEEESSDMYENPEYRPLLIYLGTSVNDYKLIVQNEKVVYCYSCGGVVGDPFQDIYIKNGFFTIEHFGGTSWRWTRNITFKYAYEDAKWYLYQETESSFNIGKKHKIIEKIKTDVDFGKIPFEQFDIYSNQDTPSEKNIF